MIVLEEIAPGDEVMIRNQRRTVTGTVRGDGSALWIEAFGTRIIFAKANRSGGWTALPKVSVVGHTQAMV